jgi:hypothetical protein
MKTVKEPELPFPQADRFDRVINLCELLKQKGFLSKEEITQNYDFDLPPVGARLFLAPPIFKG